MEGVWTIHFVGVNGFGTGVVTLINGNVLGGDQGYLYIGKYSELNDAFKAQVKVTKYATGVTNVMGLDTFDLEIHGLEMLAAGAPTKLHITGTIPGTDLKLSGVLTKHVDLPE